jgi:hypothetical protein
MGTWEHGNMGTWEYGKVRVYAYVICIYAGAVGYSCGGLTAHWYDI